MAFPEAFTTERLRAERLTADHRAEVLRMFGDPGVMAQLGGIRDEHQADEYLTRNLEHWTKYGFGLWIVYELAGETPIGRAVLRHLLVDDVDEVEVGYAFYPEFWGRGLATEVATACVAFGRERLGVSSLVAVTHRDNHASQHVLRKVGLIYERDITFEGAPASLFRTQWPEGGS
ncbi:MAG: GNAT family N-acetyltransferase [Gemmatimonadales bacterium]|nr:GNAT family N-acetyltransferase [Gemmatimonadales bacterium]